MRKIVYSNILKVVAVLLFITSIVLGTLSVSNAIIKYCNEGNDIYSFESDFSESWILSCFLDEPENALYNAYAKTLRKYDNNGGIIEFEGKITEANINELESNIKRAFETMENSEKIYYYVRWNDMVLTNCGAESAKEFQNKDFHTYLYRDIDGHVEYVSSVKGDVLHSDLMDITEYDEESTFEIGCSIKDNVVSKYKAIWESQREIVTKAFVQTFACVVAALVLLIYLFSVCGTDKNGTHNNMWLDNIWAEIHLIFIGVCGIGGVALCIMMMDAYLSGHFPYDFFYLLMGATAAIGSLGIITPLLSLVRNIKTRRIVETSMILRVLKWTVRTILRIIKWMGKKTKSFWAIIFRLLSKKTGAMLIGLLFTYTAIIGFFGIFIPESPIWLIMGILLFLFTCFVVGRRARDIDEIKKGVSEVRNGNVGYKIPELKCEDMQALAVDINDIAKGLDEAVSAKVKAERLKSELITNVSHDLKTPITSIISYTELLSKVEGLPEEAKDYIAVIAKKSDRLKRLTQDLFDISKVQSGNEKVNLEKLDIALLINQALAEQDSEIQSSGLPFCVNAPKDLYISADGRKMSRVVSNLISNILKYSMKNTRVFITAAEKNGNVEIEFKNISSYPLNFDVEEITQRFVRGDESRTEEGNGLGLAIAKSYTEICNGSFEIAIDGDMFKAILKFKKYS